MILFRYLFREVIQASLAVTTVLLLIVMSGRLAKYLTQASSGDLAAEVVFWVILFRIPDFLTLILPLGLFVGILLAYGRLYVDSEMVVMSACGAGRRRLVAITLIPTILVSIAVAFLSFYGAPTSLQKVQSLLQDPASSQGISILQEGRFQASRDGKSVGYAEQLNSATDTAHGVWLVEHRRDGKTTLVRADSGRVVGSQELGNRYFTLSSGTIYEGIVGRRDYQVTHFNEYSQKISEPDQVETIQLKVDAKSTSELLDSTQPAHIAALHWRFSLPVVVLVVALMALALSKTDHRSGRYVKMLPAILIYLIYIVAITGVRNLIEAEGYMPLWMWCVHLAFLTIALLLLFEDEIRTRFQATNPIQ